MPMTCFYLIRHHPSMYLLKQSFFFPFFFLNYSSHVVLTFIAKHTCHSLDSPDFLYLVSPGQAIPPKPPISSGSLS